jgi:hypothetical protein
MTPEDDDFVCIQVDRLGRGPDFEKLCSNYRVTDSQLSADCLPNPGIKKSDIESNRIFLEPI